MVRFRHLTDLLTRRLAPALAAGALTYTHVSDTTGALMVFLAVLGAATVLDRVRFPGELMTGARFVTAALAPPLGIAAAWLLTTVGRGASYPASRYEAALVAAWLVVGLGSWLRGRLYQGVRAPVAVIGPRAFAADLAAELASVRHPTYEVVGWIGAEGPADYRRLRWLGDLGGVREAVIGERIELLVCAGEAVRGDGRAIERVCERVADQCLDLPVRMLSANQLYEEALGHVPAGTIDAAWYRYILHPRFRTSSPASKRTFDLLVAGTMAVAALPVLAVAAVVIKLEGRGTVLYRQRRVGERGRQFEIVKLRTMRANAETTGARWSSAGDERVTRVGRVLRRTHLDELPQLWNVIRGEMTLVGPRPERPEIVSQLETRFPHYTRRHLVKPGLAGWAQVRCGYAGSELGTAWKLCHDLFYIKHRSVFADLLILVETAFVAFRDAHRALRSPGERFLIHEPQQALERVSNG